MSAVFTIGTNQGPTLWSPALRVGSIFVGYVRAAEAALQVSAGIEAWAEDAFAIDIQTHSRFFEALAAMWSTSTHELLREELRPVLLISAALLVKAGIRPEHLRLLSGDLVEQSLRIAAAMPD